MKKELLYLRVNRLKELTIEGKLYCWFRLSHRIASSDVASKRRRAACLGIGICTHHFSSYTITISIKYKISFILSLCDTKYECDTNKYIYHYLSIRFEGK